MAERVISHPLRLALGLLLGAAGPAAAQPAQWSMHTGGLSHHFQPTQAPGHTWQNQHAGLGVERRSDVPVDGLGHWTLSAAAGVLQDSRAFWGGYAGAAWLREWRRVDLPDLGLGVGAYAFYRSVSWAGRKAVVPALLPVASVQVPSAGLGLNLVYVPRVPARKETMPAVLHLQLGFRFS